MFMLTFVDLCLSNPIKISALHTATLTFRTCNVIGIIFKKSAVTEAA